MTQGPGAVELQGPSLIEKAPFCTYAKFKQGKVYVNGIEGFWSFAKERLIKHHGISKEKFLYYIKEMEWRYNHREQDLYDLLISYMLLGVEVT